MLGCLNNIQVCFRVVQLLQFVCIFNGFSYTIFCNAFPLLSEDWADINQAKLYLSLSLSLIAEFFGESHP